MVAAFEYRYVSLYEFGHVYGPSYEYEYDVAEATIVSLRVRTNLGLGIRICMSFGMCMESGMNRNMS